MGGRGSKSGGAPGGGGGAGVVNTTPQIMDIQTAPTATAAANANASAFSATDNQGFHDLYNGRAYFAKQNFDIDQQMSVIQYLSNTPESGSLYSMSQNMNTAMATGQKLTPNQQFVRDNLISAGHNLGYNLNLQRYDHPAMVDKLLSDAGLPSGYQNYTQSQIRKALLGTRYGEEKFVSTSYNDFKNAPQASKQAFDTRAIRIEYRARASTQAIMPGNGPGGALGEIIMMPSQGRKNYKIVDAKFSGKMKRRQGTQSYTMPELVLTVEVD